MKFKERQRYVRGLYSGGTFCYEASALLGDARRGVVERAGRQEDSPMSGSRAATR